MKTFASIIILTISFLCAGAFAGNALPVQIHKSNVTVVYKNQIGPSLIEISQRLCKVNFCREV